MYIFSDVYEIETGPVRFFREINFRREIFGYRETYPVMHQVEQAKERFAVVRVMVLLLVDGL